MTVSNDIRQFLMPTRIVHGHGALAQIGALARSMDASRLLVVTDPVIARQPFFQECLDALGESSLPIELFGECAVDARLHQVDLLGEQCRRNGLDGIVAIGGGSVMCCGKGAAITAANGGSLRDHALPRRCPIPPLPTLMVPTTAGSGVEVSQFSVIKDEHGGKLIVGGPTCFPTIALLDPATLASLPAALAAASGVDALCHALEAYFSSLATPLTDGIAIEAARTLFTCLRSSVLKRDPTAQAANLLASTMANMACGNARLGLGHALSDPLESELGIPHTVGVSVLLPRVIAFCAEAAPAKARTVAAAFGGEPNVGEPAEQISRALFNLYNDLGLQTHFADRQLPRARIAEMAVRAVPGLYGGAAPAVVGDDTYIDSPALRPMNVAQARNCLEDCLA